MQLLAGGSSLAAEAALASAPPEDRLAAPLRHFERLFACGSLTDIVPTMNKVPSWSCFLSAIELPTNLCIAYTHMVIKMRLKYVVLINCKIPPVSELDVTIYVLLVTRLCIVRHVSSCILLAGMVLPKV